MSEQHAPSDACQGAHCYSHDVDEEAGPDDFLTCFECNHIFRTEKDLVDAYNKEVAEEIGVPEETNASEIYACPFCIHDF